MEEKLWKYSEIETEDNIWSNKCKRKVMENVCFTGRLHSLSRYFPHRNYSETKTDRRSYATKISEYKYSLNFKLTMGVRFPFV